MHPLRLISHNGVPSTENHDLEDQMSGPTITRGRTIGPHQTPLLVDGTPVEPSTQPSPRFSLGRVPFVSRILKRWGKGRDERSQSRPPPSSGQPPIPSALAPAMESDSSPLPTLPMVVLSIVGPPHLVRSPLSHQSTDSIG
jgi:hypothetical protein